MSSIIHINIDFPSDSNNFSFNELESSYIHPSSLPVSSNPDETISSSSPCILHDDAKCIKCGFWISPPKPRSCDIQNPGTGTGKGAKVQQWCLKDEITVAGLDVHPKETMDTTFHPKRRSRENLVS
jgi:hypothetical protein